MGGAATMTRNAAVAGVTRSIVLGGLAPFQAAKRVPTVNPTSAPAKATRTSLGTAWSAVHQATLLPSSCYGESGVKGSRMGGSATMTRNAAVAQAANPTGAARSWEAAHLAMLTLIARAIAAG